MAKQIVIASENTDAIQAMYVDGSLVMHDETIYACDIAEAGGGGEIILTQEQYDLPEDADWPDSLEALRKQQSEIEAVDTTS